MKRLRPKLDRLIKVVSEWGPKRLDERPVGYHVYQLGRVSVRCTGREACKFRGARLATDHSICNSLISFFIHKICLWSEKRPALNNDKAFRKHGTWHTVSATATCFLAATLHHRTMLQASTSDDLPTGPYICGKNLCIRCRWGKSSETTVNLHNAKERKLAQRYKIIAVSHVRSRRLAATAEVTPVWPQSKPNRSSTKKADYVTVHLAAAQRLRLCFRGQERSFLCD